MKRRVALSLVLTSVLAVLPRSGLAVDQCKDVLSIQTTDEIKDTYKSNSSYTQTLNLCDLKDENECGNRSWNAGINVVVKTVPIGLKGGSAEATCRSLFTQYCRDESTAKSESQAVTNTKSLLKDDVAKRMISAWQQCVQDKYGSTKFDNLTIGSVPDALGGFALKISFTDLQPGAQPPIISKIETGTVITCSADSLDSVVGRIVTGRENQVLCRRTSKEKDAL